MHAVGRCCLDSTLCLPVVCLIGLQTIILNNNILYFEQRVHSKDTNIASFSRFKERLRDCICATDVSSAMATI